MPPARVVRVVPDVFALDKSFDYLVPAELDQMVRIGTEVRVRLHGRRVTGWVVDDVVSPKQGVQVQPIESVRGWGPPESVVGLSRWAAWRWAGPVSRFLKAASSLRVARTIPGPATSPAARSAASPAVVRSSSPAARAAPSGAGADGAYTSDPFSRGTVVVRHPPASDLLPLARAAARCLDVGSSTDTGVLVLAPAHGAAEQLSSSLRAEGRRVALLPGDWAAARAGGCVVVGTRAAAFAPVPKLVCALVLDAHDESYYEERAPTWCAWEVVTERAERDGAPCALVSPCPTLDLVRDRPLLEPSRSAERRGWPVLEIVDRRKDDPRTGLFSERVVSVVRWAAEREGRRVLCVLNRTGRVRLVSCASCAELARCERCHGPLELVGEPEERMLRCRRCAAERPVVCTGCGAGRMKALRIGVTRAREELEALAGTEVQEVWGAPRGRLVGEAASRSDMRIAVGTEALLHRESAGDAVVFLDFDAELLAPRMRASEESMALLARASRIVASSVGMRSGAGRSPGRVLVQTRLPTHEVLNAAVFADPKRLQEAEAQVRGSLGLPPFSALAEISGAAASSYASALRDAAPPEVTVSGPSDGAWLVKAPRHEVLCDLLASVARPKGRLRVAVDPVRA